ncbi:MAG TPA: hypothetical protein PLD95_02305 [bacterium]|jgi:hypothetical protein|nr:MAG: hypothetical protein BWX59_00833 [Bacteroidetes bacterium ADurb.Bin028]HOG38282.1 hypothetical protein [bacterium]
MNEEKLVTFNTAKLAKEKGFNVSCLWWYHLDTRNCYPLHDVNRVREKFHGKNIHAPTQSFLQKWLREKHNINVLVQESNISDLYKCMIGKKDRRKDISTDTLYTSDYKTYEDAIEKGLYFALKMI